MAALRGVGRRSPRLPRVRATRHGGCAACAKRGWPFSEPFAKDMPKGRKGSGNGNPDGSCNIRGRSAAGRSSDGGHAARSNRPMKQSASRNAVRSSRLGCVNAMSVGAFNEFADCRSAASRGHHLGRHLRGQQPVAGLGEHGRPSPRPLSCRGWIMFHEPCEGIGCLEVTDHAVGTDLCKRAGSRQSARNRSIAASIAGRSSSGVGT